MIISIICTSTTYLLQTTLSIKMSLAFVVVVFLYFILLFSVINKKKKFYNHLLKYTYIIKKLINSKA
jgi:hypothetical protein